jgi:hypothetical protein
MWVWDVGDSSNESVGAATDADGTAHHRAGLGVETVGNFAELVGSAVVEMAIARATGAADDETV